LDERIIVWHGVGSLGSFPGELLGGVRSRKLGFQDNVRSQGFLVVPSLKLGMASVLLCLLFFEVFLQEALYTRLLGGQSWL
jgi:hypothetical protein